MATFERPKSADGVPLDLLAVIRNSGVLSEKQLAEIRTKVLQGDYPMDSVDLAERLVRDKILTSYQAKRFLSNRSNGLIVGRYIILDRIGSGSMGRVYKAHHVMMDRVVALKIISPEIASNERVVARFQREMKLVGRLDHPNVVRAFDADQIQKVLYIVMEYVPGYSLGERLKKGPIPAGGDDRLRRPGRLGTGPRSRAGDRASRHQALEYPAERGGADQDPRSGAGRADGGG